MIHSAWDDIQKALDTHHIDRRGRLYPNAHSHSLVERHVFNKPFDLFPYALVSRGEVILTGNYPKAKIKGSMWIAVTDVTGPASVGMLWDGQQFKEPSQDA